MIEADKIERQAADWLAKKDRGGWCAQEKAAFERWLDASARHRVAYLRLEAGWEQANRLRAIGPQSSIAWFSRRSSFAFSRQWAAGVAACAALAMLVVGMHLSMTPDVLNTTVGGRASTPLPDGSHIDLNTNTSVRFKIDDSQRRVWLDQGEAYFSVAVGSGPPFVVETDAASISVLGTQFSVRHDQDALVTRVLDGAVQVSVIRQGEPHFEIGRPGDEIIVSAEGLTRDHRGVSAISDSMQWRRGYLVFDQMPLSEVASEFNRYARTRLVIAPSASDLVIGGAFEASGIEEFADLLRDVYGMTVVRRGDDILVSDQGTGI